MKILITGATGSVGLQVIKCLDALENTIEIVAGVRDIANDRQRLADYKVSFVPFDFTKCESFREALSDIDILFLLRPPQLSNVEKYVKPLIQAAKANQTKHIVFLSVQGAEKSRLIPHYKIEKLIVESGIGFTFLRPAYFMQNFITTLKDELVNQKRIFLPAGKAKFTLVDTSDIGKVAARILTHHQAHINKAYELTNQEQLTFEQMADKLTKGLGIKINYVSPNLLRFFIVMRKRKTPAMLILVMIMLHYFPKFQKTPACSNWVKELTNSEPTTFDEFVQNNRNQLIAPAVFKFLVQKK